MPFDLNQWRDEARQLVADFARDPHGALRGAGVTSLYGFLLGSTLLPVAAAYAADPGSAIVAASGVVGGLGANLIANIVQQRYDAANVLALAAQDAQTPAFAPAYEAIAKQFDIFPLAEQALAQAGQADVLTELRDELRRLGKAGQFSGATITIEQSGGVNMGVGNTIGSVGDVFGGDKVQGDKFSGDKVVHYGAPSPASTEAAHVQRLIDINTNRLKVLEQQAAQFGNYAPPHILTEIDTVRAEIARLRALLD